MKAIWITVFCFFMQMVSAQNEPNNIFALCLIEGSVDAQDGFDIPSEISMIAFPIERKETGEKEGVWVKRKADSNCLSQNPDDCLVWCLVERPAYEYSINFDGKYSDLTFLPWLSKEVIEEELENGMSAVWLPVLDKDDLEYGQFKRILKKLKKKKYLPRNHEKKITNQFIQALHLYQKDNGLPIGNLNLETLDDFDIKY